MAIIDRSGRYLNKISPERFLFWFITCMVRYDYDTMFNVYNWKV